MSTIVPKIKRSLIFAELAAGIALADVGKHLNPVRLGNPRFPNSPIRHSFWTTMFAIQLHRPLRSAIPSHAELTQNECYKKPKMFHFGRGGCGQTLSGVAKRFGLMRRMSHRRIHDPDCRKRVTNRSDFGVALTRGRRTCLMETTANTFVPAMSSAAILKA